MSVIKVEQADLMLGYTLIESMHAIVGQGTAKVVAIRGGAHPKMRLLVKDADTKMNDGEGLSAEYSFAFAVIGAGTGQIMTVSHKDGLIAGETAAVAANKEIYPFAPAATSDESIFEADEDVILQPSVQAGAGTDCAIVVLKFEVVD